MLLNALLLLPLPAVQTRQQQVLDDKHRFENAGNWFYNDLEGAFELAKQENRPLLAVLRCIPCHECVQLDDDLVESSPKLQKLMKEFVLVRLTAANGLDLSLFEFDTDQSFSVFFFNGDRTLYGRYGTRSHRSEWEQDVSVEGLGEALEGALELHRHYPANRSSLAGKQAGEPLFATPARFPSLAEKYSEQIEFDGNVVRNCIHCHMIGDAAREHHRRESGRIPEQLLFSHPHPKSLGLILDPAQKAVVRQTLAGSPAANAGLLPGDSIQSLGGQPILSIADVQWVLHQSPPGGGTLQASVARDGAPLEIRLELPAGWRTRDDLSWRASSWPLRQKGLGGMLLVPASGDDRRRLGLADTEMALTVQHVGAFPPHDRAKRAGVQKGDILVEYDGRRDLLRETDLLVHAIHGVAAGETVALRFFRGDSEIRVDIATAR